MAHVALQTAVGSSVSSAKAQRVIGQGLPRVFLVDEQTSCARQMATDVCAAILPATIT